MPPEGCRLIINADDFGLREGVNEAVLRAHDGGVLTSTSLMVGEGAFDPAVAAARERPELAVGLHLTLLRGSPVLTGPAISGIIGPGGEFGSDPFLVGMRYFFSPAARRAVRREVEAQFERFRETGLPLSHVDAHLHFQLHPVLWRAILDVAPRYECRTVRIPLDCWEIHRRLDPRDAARQRFLATLFAWFCARLRRQARAAGIRSPEFVFGTYRTGRLDADYLVRLVAALPDGTHELHCHPDLSTPSGRVEFESLLSPEVATALQARGVERVTYQVAGPA